MRKKLLGGLLLALHTSLALAQTKPAPAEGWQTVFFEQPGTALPLLQAAAARNSPILRGVDIEKAIAQEEIKLARKTILNTVALTANYNYGNLATIGGTGPNPVPSPGGFGQENTGRYSAGVGFSLPIELIAGRGNRIRREQLNLQRTETTRQEQERQLRQEIITLYQNVVIARKLLTLRQEALVNARTNYQLAERQFRQGQLTLPAFSEANSLITEVTATQESARNQYDTAFLLLEEVVGAKISTLMTTAR